MTRLVASLQLLFLLYILVTTRTGDAAFLGNPPCAVTSHINDAQVQQNQCRHVQQRQHQPLHSFWRHWIPETDFMTTLGGDGIDDSGIAGDDNSKKGVPFQRPSEPRRRQQHQSASSSSLSLLPMLGSSANVPLAITAMVLMLLVAAPPTGVAVSGGGLDYAGIDISGQDFSNSNYKGKDFTQVIAKGTKFSKSNLQGCRFYKAYLVNTDFSDSDIRGASMEDTSMDGANLKNAIAVGSYFSSSILDVATVENADFTDAQFPVKALPLLCERPDMKGTNPVTGADTRESAMCP